MADVYALDTNVLIFYGFQQRNRIGSEALKVLDRFREGSVALVVPSIVLVELWSVLKGRRFQVETTLRTWWNQVARTGLLTIDLTAEDVLTATGLNWDHRDPYDRLIVATTLNYGCPLITSDAAITGWGGIEVVW